MLNGLNGLIRDIIYCVYGDFMPMSNISMDRNCGNMKIVIDFHERINYGNGYEAVYVGLEPFEIELNIRNNHIYRIINNLLKALRERFGVPNYHRDDFWDKLRQVLNKHSLIYKDFLNEEYCQEYLKIKMERELKK